jgi:taurine dioxygenase
MVKATGSASESSSESRLTVAPSTPVIGAEVSGVDLREPLTPVLRAELRRLLLRHRVLFLRDQQIDTGEQVAFAENFGDMLVFRTGSDPHPGYPGVDQVGIHQVHPAPQAPPSEASRAQRFRWHIDASARLVPPAIIVVRAISVPPTGGDSFWSSGVAAYQGLPDDLKESLEGLYVTHDRIWWQHEGRDIDHPLISHRLVRTHPETGEKAPVPQLCSGVVGHRDEPSSQR